MGKPNKELIELCEDLLSRARSGVMEGLATVEIREGDRIDGHIYSMNCEESMKAVAFLGHLAVETFMSADNDQE